MNFEAPVRRRSVLYEAILDDMNTWRPTCCSVVPTHAGGMGVTVPVLSILLPAEGSTELCPPCCFEEPTKMLSTTRGGTPLMWASERGCMSVVKTWPPVLM